MKKSILILVVLALLVLSGCTEKKPLCSPPYIEYKTGDCCLDKNENSICDNDEPAGKILDAVAENSNSVIKIVGDIAKTQLIGENGIAESIDIAGTIADGLISSIQDVTKSNTEIIEAGSPEAKELESFCPSTISMKFIEFNDVKQICLDNRTNTINFTIQNSGTTQIDGMIVQAISKTSIAAKEIKTTLPISGIIRDYMPYDLSQNGAIVYVRFNPEITANGGTILCASNALINEDIGICSS